MVFYKIRLEPRFAEFAKQERIHKQYSYRKL